VAASTGFVEYTVQPGDSLIAIARSYGVSQEAILDNNTIANPSSLTVGQVLRIPVALDARGYVQYTVQPGDTLIALARRYGVTQEAILAVNTIANPASLTVGDVISIPLP
jgi:LysM repeat protein